MFQRLFTPLLTTTFNISPRGSPEPRTASTVNGLGTATLATPRSLNSFNEQESIDVDPEDFARDVLVELMRNAVDRLKSAEDMRGKLETLAEIHRIMLEDAVTKEVFREMDGFLVLIGVLSTLHATPTESDERNQDILEGTRLSSMIVCEAIRSHKDNVVYFETRVGYDSFSEAVHPLLLDPALALDILDHLLSLAVATFPTTFFTLLRDTPQSQLETHAAELATRLPTLANAGAFRIVWTGVHELPRLDHAESQGEETTGSWPRLTLYKLTERLLTSSHRTHVVLSSLGLSEPLFKLYLSSRPGSTDAPSTTPLPVVPASDRERALMGRLLRRLLETGVSSTAEARTVFQAAIRPSSEPDVPALDPDVLEVIRGATKAKWPPHFILQNGASLCLDEDGVRGLPTGGMTFMMWLFIDCLPSAPETTDTEVNGQTKGDARKSKGPVENSVLFGLKLPNKWVFKVGLLPNGSIEIFSGAYREPVPLTNTVLPTMRWVHLAVVYHANRASTPTVRIFLDGNLSDAMQWVYPKAESVPQTGTWVLGDLPGTRSSSTAPSWSLASAYVLAAPLHDDVLRLVHHLSPRYAGTFQAPRPAKQLTYESATSLSVHLTGLATHFRLSGLSAGGGLTAGSVVANTPIMKALRDGFGVPEQALVFALRPGAVTLPAGGQIGAASMQRQTSRMSIQEERRGWRLEGDVLPARGYCLDLAVWRLGGAAVPLRLVTLARTGHELSRALAVLSESVRNSWANAEDMERIRGYEVLSHVLREKAAVINVTCFEILFEMLGMNFRHPDQSTVTNSVGYRSLALDFELWGRTKRDIQVAFFDHFVTLLSASRFKRFNAFQRLARLDLVRRLLFVLQTRWFAPELIPDLLKALRAALTALPGPDDTIKPLIAYLAANLHDDSAAAATVPPSSPASAMSVTVGVIDTTLRRDKAEQALTLFVSLAREPEPYARIAGALPMARVALLLLGDRPPPSVAARVLQLLGACMRGSTGFARKFELVSGWAILKTVLPRAWDASVHQAAFDVLLGRNGRDTKADEREDAQVSCPYIVPAIFTSLRRGLETVASQMQTVGSRRDSMVPLSPASASGSTTPTGRSVSGGVPNAESWSAEATVEALIEELISLHASSATFRQVFRSSQTTMLFVEAYKFFVGAVSGANAVKPRTIRLLEKLTHFALSLALDPDVAGGQKREILDNLQKAEAILDAGVRQPTAIDPSLVSESRALHRRILSARLSLQVGERAVLKSFGKIADWRKAISASERKRLRKNVLDLREQNRQIEALDDWAYSLVSERGLWAQPDREPKWRLDETEGPYRIRKKLERQEAKVSVTRITQGDALGRQVQAVEEDAESAMRTEPPPWAESYELGASDIDDQVLAEEVVDDKHRRVRHELEPGDTIQTVDTVARIAGVDSSPGLLICGTTHLYMLDGLVESDDGEVIDAHDAPKKLFFAPGSIVDLDGPQRALRWSYSQVAGFSDRTFIFRDVGLELYFKDSRSLLVVFLNKEQRERFNHHLNASLPAAGPATPATPATFLKTPMMKQNSARILTGFRRDELQTAQRKWQAREISNFTYLSIINQISGRTPSDATQYPIFPWVIKDYTSETLDLTSPDTYRDLKCPMGAQNKGRRDSAYARYTSLESVGEQPFHYGTHFSSSMIVCHFLIRMEPYTHMFKTLQGGDWDLPDRLFSDMARAFDSASKDSRGDVRELIPEFFTCPEFLENSANLNFGVMQNTGERIHHVKLPPWAKEDPLLFVSINRSALESDYVSENLPGWIDLIWGYKQQDSESLNVFHPLSYEGAIDLDTISDELEREATVGIIHNFGQTPRRLFSSPHPERFHHGLSSLPIGNLSGVAEDYRLMARSTRVIKDLGSDTPVRELAVDAISERVLPCAEGFACVPDRPHEQVGWGTTRLGKNAGGELRAVVDRKAVHVVENAFPSCAAFADSETLATGSSDYLVRLWRLERTQYTGRDAPLRLILTNIMRGHTDEVLCITASRPWSLLVTGSADGTAIFWDLNRGTYTRSIFHDSEDKAPVTLVAINESTGYVATSSSSRLCLHTINGRPIVTLDLTVPTLSHYTITSMAFLEREFSRIGVLATGAADGTIALRTWNADDTPSGERARWQFSTLRTLKVRDDQEAHNFTAQPAVTALKFVGETLYHGEDTGKVFSWELPE